MTRRISVTEAARGFSEMINRARFAGETTILLRGGKPVAKVVPINAAEFSTGASLSKAWKSLPHLSKREAERFAKDIEKGRRRLPKLRDPWL